jgi:hypothetical protein
VAIDEPVELDIHKIAMLGLLEYSQNPGTLLDSFEKLLSKLLGKKVLISRMIPIKNVSLKIYGRNHCPLPLMVKVGSPKVPWYDLLQHTKDSLSLVSLMKYR